ncbi:hypothetical protein [Nostoc sp.]|uniref:hypothetical protein n=1 Tax=Nostoc sp. TaxID=1180 RepID=UPI003FA5648B
MADSASENYPLRLIFVPPGYSLAEFVTLLLDKCSIIVYVGSGYSASGEGFFRIALTISDERLQEGIRTDEICWHPLRLMETRGTRKDN